MALRHSFLLPKQIFAAIRRTPAPIRVSAQVLAASECDAAGACALLATDGERGLASDEAALRLAAHGPNTVAADTHGRGWFLFARAWLNPLVLLLTVLAAISFATGDSQSGAMMALMVATGVALKFVQESRADAAAARLKAMISVTATVVRDGEAREVPLAQLVPGDVVHLAAGDMVPGDVRVLSGKDLFVVQSSLTGESFPVEKSESDRGGAGRPALERANLAFLGTSIESGSATAVIAATGRETYLGSMAAALVGAPPETGFDKGVRHFTWLMLRFMLVLVPLVFVVNGLTKGAWGEAFFFSLAVAVGLTPEMLPAIVSVCLSKGALAMARKKVIVKRLNSIQNLGAMDVLCTDKTGTLTLDRVILERHCDVLLAESDDVLRLAFLNSHFQTGLKNVLDRAVLAHAELHAHVREGAYAKLDEIPFDFTRRIMSVVVRTPDGGRLLIAKGAPESIFPRCASLELGGELLPISHPMVFDLQQEYERLSADGFRVLAVACRNVDEQPGYGRADERDLVLKGYVAFLDPPKDTAVPAIAALRAHGVSVKVLTGDNELVSRKICREVGLDSENVLLGSRIETLDDAGLALEVDRATLFARVSPAHKRRVILALQARGHTVGYLGDGINDAPALRAADVGVSVEGAVDIAKESADMILLEKSLMVLDEGVLEGRKVFVNILKYIRMGASSSFGNMFSMLGASAFLPFLPMTPVQILANNLLYDASQMAIPTDDVDPELIQRPRPWSMSEIARFILCIGPCSSVFDYTTFALLLYGFGCLDPARASFFQTGWFVESLLTQTLIIHVIRTRRIPFVQGRASWPLTLSTAAVVAIGAWLPYSPLAGPLGFTPLPAVWWPLMAATLAGYVTLTQLVKGWLFRRGWA